MIEASEFNRQFGQIRSRLERMFWLDQFDEIGQIPGISIVHRRETRPEIEDCGQYAFKLGFRETVAKLDRVEKYPPVDYPKPGDYVHYITRYENGRYTFSHIGIWLSEDLVESKWNHGHVYRHLLFLVPSGFGDRAVIVRDP